MSTPTDPVDVSGASALDRLAWMATRAIRAPVALVLVTSEGRTIVSGQSGLPSAAGREVPERCYGSEVATNGACVDPQALSGTWEAAASGARAALGFPLHLGEGPALGALVILDLRTRVWTAEEIQAARLIAEAVCTELDRRDAHVRLRAAESFQALIERSPEAVLVHVDGRIRFANAAAVTLMGGSAPDDILGHAIETFLAPPYLKEVEVRLVQPSSDTPTLPHTEERLVRLDGTHRWVELATLAYLQGDTPAVQMFLRDVTDRRDAREALRAQEAHLRLLVERIPALQWTTDRALRMQFWRAETTPSPPARGATVQDFFGKSEDSVPVTTHRQALSGESASGILEWREGEYEVRVEPLRDDAGTIIGTVGIAVDTTLRRRAEARERDVREIDALGRVAGGVAHGVNNALATIVGVASVMVDEPSLSEKGKKNLQAILDASGRAQALTSNLLGFSRQGSYRTVRIELNEVARAAAGWTMTQRPAIQIILDPDLLLVEGDPEQVRQALHNVCQNALDATRAGGTIRISTRRAQVDAEGEGQPHLPPGRYACLEVLDTGAGMPDDVRSRAIEPFFTTKAFGEGAGLGLSMAFGVVRHLGGDLQLKSAPGEGTCVTLYFPAADEAPRAPVLPAKAPWSAAEREAGKRVLVVDDDEWVQFSSRRILESLGYEVIEAMNGPAALALFAAARDPFAFILLDLRMPGMDGEEVLRRLLALDPKVRVILCTGFERDQVSQRIFALGHVGFLGKPFGAKDLLEQLKVMSAEGV